MYCDKFDLMELLIISNEIKLILYFIVLYDVIIVHFMLFYNILH